MNELRGRFYYRLTSNGNLVGEFPNNYSTHPQTESAERIDSAIDDKSSAFEGDFLSTWFEPTANQAMFSQLRIEAKPLSNQIFTVHWADPTSRAPLFEGEAMIGEGLLIGNYWALPPSFT